MRPGWRHETPLSENPAGLEGAGTGFYDFQHRNGRGGEAHEDNAVRREEFRLRLASFLDERSRARSTVEVSATQPRPRERSL